MKSEPKYCPGCDHEIPADGVCRNHSESVVVAPSLLAEGASPEELAVKGAAIERGARANAKHFI